MIYVSRITIAANTAEAAPMTEPIEVFLSVVKGATFIFESGAEAVGARLLDRSLEFLPAVGSPERWVRDNGEAVRLDFTYRLQAAPYQITIAAFNTTGAEVELEVYIRVEQFDFEELLLEELKGLRSDLAVPIPAGWLEKQTEV
ncbi:hypothetical protein LCGC14_1810510 [marine sediment metagenome]|uniref:Uncharacterized protein n=1 Tax=marine sediment metagenome TaxID=412755 RepID=A0A0F9GLT0_9ZZZZ